MKPSFASILGLCICKIDISAQKIDGSRLEGYEIVIALFQLVDRNKNSRFFKKTFLLIDIGIDLVVRIFILTLSNIEVKLNN